MGDRGHRTTSDMSPAVRTQTKVAFPLWEGLVTMVGTETKVGRIWRS